MFDDMIADIKANANLSPIVTELVTRGRNLLTFPLKFYIAILFEYV